MKVLITDLREKISKTLGEDMKADEERQELLNQLQNRTSPVEELTNRKARRAAKAKRRKENKALAKKNKVRLIYNPFSEKFEPEF